MRSKTEGSKEDVVAAEESEEAIGSKAKARSILLIAGCSGEERDRVVKDLVIRLRAENSFSGWRVSVGVGCWVRDEVRDRKTERERDLMVAGILVVRES